MAFDSEKPQETFTRPFRDYNKLPANGRLIIPINVEYEHFVVVSIQRTDDEKTGKRTYHLQLFDSLASKNDKIMRLIIRAMTDIVTDIDPRATITISDSPDNIPQRQRGGVDYGQADFINSS